MRVSSGGSMVFAERLVEEALRASGRRERGMLSEVLLAGRDAAVADKRNEG
jgi:hypothetical protein